MPVPVSLSPVRPSLDWLAYAIQYLYIPIKTIIEYKMKKEKRGCTQWYGLLIEIDWDRFDWFFLFIIVFIYIQYLKKKKRKKKEKKKKSSYYIWILK